jgi:TPR repeat protein
MRKRSGSILLVCGFALAALAVASFHSAASGQSAELVLCDRIAADPADPDKPADVKGVSQIAPSDIETAIKFCKIAAKKSPRALYQLGRAYAAKRQVPESLIAYRQAADKGNTSAMVELGVMLGTGSGVPKDQAEARKLFERAAKAGNRRGVANLAALSGATPSSPPEAGALLEKAAEANSAEAEFQLGVALAQGTDRPKDDVAARALFEKAAAQGHAEAMLWAGAFAQLGRGGPEDARVARAYYEKSAALGNEEAKTRIKNMDCPYVLKDKRGNVMTHLCF